MTATERLRQLLDERGVEWMPSAWDAKTETFWHTSDGIGCLAIQGEVKLQVSWVPARQGRGRLEGHKRGTESAESVSELRAEGVRVMSDLLAKCDWLNGDVLVLVLPQDPSSIHVKLFDSKHAPSKVYVPESYPKQRELGADYLRLGKENEKLRELVRDMARAWWACDNERCPHGSSCDAAVSEGKLADCEMERRMAELGVEVDA